MKLNIDTTSTRGAHTKALNTKASTLVMELEDRLDGMTAAQQHELLDQLQAVLGNEDHTAAFAAGTFAQQSSGKPAAALPVGSTPTPNDLQDALDTIMSAPGATDGQKAALKRIFFPGRDHLDVEDDGTPKALNAAKEEARKAKEDLQNEKDPTKSGSLAKQLADAQAATPADMVRKADVKTLADEAKTAVDAIKPAMTGGAAAAKTDALAKVDAIVAKVG